MVIKMKKIFMHKISAVFILLLMFIGLFGCAATNKTAENKQQDNHVEATKSEDKKIDSSQDGDSKNKKIINDFQGVADYIHKNGTLPENFITKAQANKLGWRPGDDLSKVAPGKSIGGDIFKNAEKSLQMRLIEFGMNAILTIMEDIVVMIGFFIQMMD